MSARDEGAWTGREGGGGVRRGGGEGAGEGRREGVGGGGAGRATQMGFRGESVSV